MNNHLKNSFGIGTLLLMHLAAGCTAFAVGGTPVVALPLMAVAFMMVRYSVLSDTITVGTNGLAAFMGAALSLVLSYEEGVSSALHAVSGIVGGIMGIIAVVLYVVIMGGVIFQSKSLYQDGSLARELQMLADLWVKAVPALRWASDRIATAYERQLPTKGTAAKNEVAELRAALEAANARIDALEKARREDAMQALSDMGQEMDLSGRISDIESVLTKPQQDKLA
ncbi:MAG: hypothetical protein GC134_06590 [Proteobacteria bacterium]|nr:hypothetical protein [Pseudomonadota bacterium]